MPAPLQKREFILNQCREKARHRHQIRNQGESGKNEKVRRKAVASLGEFMFYAATQLDDEQADPVWNLSQIAVKSLVKCLHQGEDDIVRFYACKTIENITA